MLPTGPIPLPRTLLDPGEHTLSVRMIGRNESSSAYAFGLDALELTPADGSPSP